MIINENKLKKIKPGRSSIIHELNDIYFNLIQSE